MTRGAWAGALLAALTLAAYHEVGSNEFVAYDDPAYVTENAQVARGITGEGIAWAFTSTESYNWHPLTWLSHMLDVELFGLDAGLHHATSVVLHALVAVVLFAALRLLTRSLGCRYTRKCARRKR